MISKSACRKTQCTSELTTSSLRYDSFSAEQASTYILATVSPLHDGVVQRQQPGRAVFVAQRNACVHFCNVHGRMKIVGVDESPMQLGGQRLADCRFAHPGYAHEQNDHEDLPGVSAEASRSAGNFEAASLSSRKRSGPASGLINCDGNCSG